MNFDWTSFGTGFAKAASEKMDKEEEDAKLAAASQVKSLYENYTSVVKENRTISNDIKEKINVIKGFAPDASPDQLVSLAQDRGVLDMLYTRMKDKDFDSTGFNINNFVSVKEASPSGLSAEERIDKLFTIPSAVNSASAAFKSIAPEPTEGEGFLSGLMKKSGLRGAQSGIDRATSAYGVSMDQLLAAKEYTRTITPSGAKYDLSLLKNKKGFAEAKDATQLEMLDAKALYDKDPTNPEALKKLKDATSKVATIVAIEGISKAEAKKTEEDIRTELTNIIVNPKTSPEEKRAAKLELEQRQKLQSKDNAEAAIQTDLINKIQDPNTSPEDKEKARLALDERQKLQSKDSNEAAIQTDLINKILDPNTTPQEAEKLKRQLDARQKLSAKDVPAEKVTQANYIVIASRAISSAVTKALPPGSLTVTTNADGTVQMMPSDLVKGSRFTAAINAAEAGLISQFTKNGIPLSEFHKNALISVNIYPDAQGRFVASSAAAEEPAAAPAPAAPAVVAPLVPRPAAPAAPAAAPAAPAAPAAAPAASKPLRPAGIKLTPDQEAAITAGEKAIAAGAKRADVEKRLRDNKVPGF